MASRTTQSRGFTLIELLVVMAIISVLVALLLPAVQAAREAARRVQCSNNLKQMGIALHTYHERAKCLPPGYFFQQGYKRGGFGWALMILPEIEQSAVYNAFNFDQPLWSESNATASHARVESYFCPSDPYATTPIEREDLSYSRSNYVGNFGPADMDALPEDRQGIFSRNSSTRWSEVSDGLAHTLCVGERHNGFVWAIETVWLPGGNFPCGCPKTPIAARALTHFQMEASYVGAVKGMSIFMGPPENDGPEEPLTARVEPDDHARMTLFHAREIPTQSHILNARDPISYHSASVNFLFCDGSVRPLSNTIDFTIFQAFGTRAGGESMDWPSF